MRLLSAALVLACAAVVSVVAAQTAPPSAKVDTSVKAVLDKAERYIDDYQQKLSYLLADEVYTQRVLDDTGDETAAQVTKADFFITFVATRNEWMAVRDVREVNGEPVENRGDLAALVAKPEAGPILAARNSRFNIGSIKRNFSEPTLALLLLDTRNRSRVKFDRVRIEPAGTMTLVVVKFKEQNEPTLIYRDDGRVRPQPVFSTGEMTIDAETGKVMHTTITFDGPIRAEMTTSYTQDAKLGLLLPSLLQERYERKDDGLTEVVTCTARYTNYRKFGVNVIIR
jgi:hypothetical protein